MAGRALRQDDARARRRTSQSGQDGPPTSEYGEAALAFDDDRGASTGPPSRTTLCRATAAILATLPLDGRDRRGDAGQPTPRALLTRSPSAEDRAAARESRTPPCRGAASASVGLPPRCRQGRRAARQIAADGGLALVVTRAVADRRRVGRSWCTSRSEGPRIVLRRGPRSLRKWTNEEWTLVAEAYLGSGTRGCEPGRASDLVKLPRRRANVSELRCAHRMAEPPWHR